VPDEDRIRSRQFRGTRSKFRGITTVQIRGGQHRAFLNHNVLVTALIQGHFRPVTIKHILANT
ncbi:hypothetical protein B296_00048116, partial [Ensete ventricosum]